MNWFGLRVSGRVQLVIAAVLARAARWPPRSSRCRTPTLGNLTPFAPHGWLAVGSAAALLVWAFAGWEAVTSLSGEYREPRPRHHPGHRHRDRGHLACSTSASRSRPSLVLGDQPGKAPLSDLLVLGFGEAARPVTTVVAVLLSVGAINAYFAGGARLGAALARDGSLPAWLAHGSTAGEVPRRSLGRGHARRRSPRSPSSRVLDLSLNAPLLMTTGAFTLVYAVGTAAALKLLPRGTWACAAAPPSASSPPSRCSVSPAPTCWARR